MKEDIFIKKSSKITKEEQRKQLKTKHSSVKYSGKDKGFYVK